jgi:hypothetical protein
LAGVHLDSSGVARPHSDLFPSDTDEDIEGANDFLNDKEVSHDAFGDQNEEYQPVTNQLDQQDEEDEDEDVIDIDNPEDLARRGLKRI